MLNFKNTNYIFGIIVLLIILDLIFSIVSLPIVQLSLLLASIYILLLIYGSVFIKSDFYLKAICNKKTNEKVVAISFDDGPIEITNQILEVLKEQQIKAAFFCIGEKIEKNKEIIKRIDKEGHLIGNHTYTHNFWFDLFSTGTMIKELQKTEKIINDITGKKVRMFRPPYGVTNPRIKKAVNKMKYITIGWSLKSFDIKRRKIINDGDIILFHDTNEQIIKTLKGFIDYISENNYKILRIDELLNIEPYAN